MERRYGRAQYLRDAAWLGVPAERAFSRDLLRRRRDRLMRIHHPDRGGAADKAAEINLVYGRMIAWLDAGGQAENALAARLKSALASGAGQIGAAAMVVAAVAAGLAARRKP